MKECQALVLVPTWRRALRIQKTFLPLSEYMPMIEVHACFDGTDVAHDIAKLRDGVHVVVGTSARIHELINRDAALRTQHTRVLVLDEVSRLAGRQTGTTPEARSCTCLG